MWLYIITLCDVWLFSSIAVCCCGTLPILRFACLLAELLIELLFACFLAPAYAAAYPAFWGSVEALFLLVGVDIIFSAELTLSLSVLVIYVLINDSLPNPLPPLLAKPDRLPSYYWDYWDYCTSELDLIWARILLDFHWVHRKLYSCQSSKSPMDHQNLDFRALRTRRELLPLPI